ncbi:hypothetical protein PENSPDRAFT_664056 [Peniophora sp. CONT]|nr:hypothetical protein PENSPDRAFT_664056 [Peniophora sp. CONT]
MMDLALFDMHRASGDQMRSTLAVAAAASILRVGERETNSSQPPYKQNTACVRRRVTFLRNPVVRSLSKATCWRHSSAYSASSHKQFRPEVYTSHSRILNPASVNRSADRRSRGLETAAWTTAAMGACMRDTAPVTMRGLIAAHTRLCGVCFAVDSRKALPAGRYQWRDDAVTRPRSYVRRVTDGQYVPKRSTPSRLAVSRTRSRRIHPALVAGGTNGALPLLIAGATSGR